MTVSTRYTGGGHWPCNDATSTTAPEASGSGTSDITAASALATATTMASAETGWITSITGADGYMGIPADEIDWDMSNGDSFIWMFWLKMADPGGNKNIAGNAAWYRAIWLRYINSSTDELRCTFGDNSTELHLDSGTTKSPFTTASIPHHIAIAVDGTTKSAYMFVDGVVTPDARSSPRDLSTITGDTLESQEFTYGTAQGSGSNTVAASFQDIHFLYYDGVGLPMNVQSIVDFARSAKFTTMTTDLTG